LTLTNGFITARSLAGLQRARDDFFPTPDSPVSKTVALVGPICLIFSRMR